MKKLFFALILVSGAAFTNGTATAQAQITTTGATRPSDDGRLELASKTNELEAYIMRNNPELTQKVLPQIMAMMQTHMARNSTTAGTLTGEAQTKLTANVKAQQMLYSAFKRLSSDPVKNQKELVGTARKFVEIY